MYTEMPAGFVDVMQMAKHSVKLVEKLVESNRELHKTQRKLKVTGGAVYEAQQLALSKEKEVCLCRQQLEGVNEHLGMAHEKITRVEAAGDEAAVRSKGELARSQKECNCRLQRTSATKSSVTNLQKKLTVVAARTIS